MAKATWEIVENAKTKRAYLHIFAATKPDAYPSVAEIRKAAVDKGFNPYSLFSDVNLEKTLQKALAITGEEFSAPIVIESTFDVRLIIAPDKTTAHLYIRKSSDKNNSLDLKLVSNIISNSHLKGIDTTKIKEAINSFRASPAMELTDFLIAEGNHPGRGKNRELVPQVDWLAEEETQRLVKKIADYFKYAPVSSTEKALVIGKDAKLAYAIKGALVYELSPPESGTPGADVYGKEIPGLPGNDPFFQLLDNLTLSPAGIKAEKTGLLVATEIDGILHLRIIPYSDGKVTAVVTPNNMEVSLIIESEEGAGTPISTEMALCVLEEKKIQGKIDTALIDKTIASVRLSKKSAEIIVLRGLYPVQKGSSRITWDIYFPIVLFSEASKAVNITAGARILSIQKLPAGADGCDVFGMLLKASTAQSEPVPEHDETITVETVEDIQYFIASVSGELILEKNKLRISDTKEISGDIDEKIGDIFFPGNLVLNGIIKTGRTVKAEGSLMVTGDAEASLVSANDTVTMNGGIRGSGRGTVWAKQAIHLSFAENARILAGQDIVIDNYCFQCTVKTNGMLICKGNPAVLLGGNIHASKGVEVFELGSEKKIRTSISFGQNYLVSDQIEVSEKEVQKIQEIVKKIDEDMLRISTTDPRIHELRRKKLELLKKNDKLTVRIFTLKEQFETHIISHIRVESTVYPGVILESHGRYYEVRESASHVIFLFDQTTGQITCNPIKN